MHWIILAQLECQEYQDAPPPPASPNPNPPPASSATSFSIKSVAPALAPKTSYAGLEVAGGVEASQQLFRLLLRSDAMTKAEIRKLRAELLNYCEMDTAALVGVCRALSRMPEECQT